MTQTMIFVLFFFAVSLFASKRSKFQNTDQFANYIDLIWVLKELQKHAKNDSITIDYLNRDWKRVT